MILQTMGALLAKFKKEKTTAVVLENLQEEIKALETYTLNTQERKKRFVGNFLAISIGVYVIAFISFYFVYFPPTWDNRIIYSVPLLIFPFVILLLRKVFTWHFQRKLNKNASKLTALRTEKKKILEQVMDKETYKVAVNLLEKYGDRNTKFAFAMTPRPASTGPTNTIPLNTPYRPLSATSSNSHALVASNLRNTLNVTASGALPTRPMPSNASQLSVAQSNTRLAGRQLALSPQTLAVSQELRRRTPFPIINPQEKGVFERIVDVLIGDGPQHRFAMICKECLGHNGMAHEEESDYAAFRCAYCNALNPARKARPVAPRLPGTPAQSHVHKQHSSESSTPTTTDDDDSDKENTERRRQRHNVTRMELTESTNSKSDNGVTAAAHTSESEHSDGIDQNQQNLVEDIVAGIADNGDNADVADTELRNELKKKM